MNDGQVIVFDLGRVLIDFDHRIAVRRIKDYCALSEADIYNLFFDSDITDRYERGLINSYDFFEEVKALLRATIAYEEFVPIWNEIFTPHPGMLELVRSLHSRHSLYMVSNINESHALYLKEHFSDYFRYFKHLFLSYAVHMRKPDDALYAHMIDFINVPPQRIIYTDDRLELVEAARKHHIDAFVFQSLETCISELRKRAVVFDAQILPSSVTTPKEP